MVIVDRFFLFTSLFSMSSDSILNILHTARMTLPISIFVLLTLCVILPVFAQPMPSIQLSGPGWRAEWGPQSQYQLRAGSTATQAMFVDNSGPGVALIRSLRIYWDPNVDGNWQLAAQSDPNIILPNPSPSHATEYLWKFDLTVPVSIKANYGQVNFIFECLWVTASGEREIARTLGMFQIQGAQVIQIQELIPQGFLTVPSLQLGQTWSGSQPFTAPTGSKTTFQFTITDLGPGNLKLIRGEFYWDPSLNGNWQLAYQEDLSNYQLTQSQGVVWKFDATIPSSFVATYATNGVPQVKVIVQVVYSSDDGQHTKNGQFNLAVPGATIKQETATTTATTQINIIPQIGLSNPYFLVAMAAIAVVLGAAVYWRYGVRRANKRSGLKPQGVSKMVYCIDCGYVNPAGNEFCGKCGKKLHRSP